DWRLVKGLLVASVPAAVVGSLLAGSVDADLLKVVLGIGLLGVAVVFIRHHDSPQEDAAIGRGEGVIEPSFSRTIITQDGQRYTYRVCRTGEGRLFAGVGGLFVGLISTGLGELNSYALVKRCRVPSRITVATSVAVVAGTVLAASSTHVVDFVRDGGDAISTVLSLVTFTVPGVLIGGQLGPRLAHRIPGDTLIRFLGWLFLGIAAITIGEVVL
ncbi:MAG: sulfite exporter TauE/SafE family protein, partial [Acidimicrobiia bacterium]